jgi:hypothetical protein
MRDVIRKQPMSPFAMTAAARLAAAVGALVILWGSILWAVSV